MVDFNLLAQVVAIGLLMGFVFALRDHVGSYWIVLGFEALLFTVLLRAVDQMAPLLGFDLLDTTGAAALRWLVIVVMYVAFIETWIRRNEISRIEAERKRLKAEREEHARLEASLREERERLAVERRRQAEQLKAHEDRMDHIVNWGDLDALYARRAGDLNRQIMSALKQTK